MRKKGLSCFLFLVLFLLPGFAQGFSIDRSLGVDEFYAAYRNADAGWRIEGSFSTSSNIEFFICDADNYTKWRNSESGLLYEHSEETTSQTFNFTIPHDSTWYVVFLNVQTHATSLEANLSYIDLTGIVQTQVTWTAQSLVVTPLFIGFLFAIPVVCLLGIGIVRRGSEVPAVRYDEILPKPD